MIFLEFVILMRVEMGNFKNWTLPIMLVVSLLKYVWKFSKDNVFLLPRPRIIINFMVQLVVLQV